MIREILYLIFGLVALALVVSAIMRMRHRRAVERDSRPPINSLEHSGEAFLGRGVSASVRIRAHDMREAMVLSAHYRTAANVCEAEGYRDAGTLLRQAAEIISPIYGHSKGAN